MRVVAVLVLLLAPLLAGCATAPTRGSPDVVASFYPLAYLAQRIVGDKLTVGTLVPADAEPHDYDLKPSDQDALERAKLVVFAGPGLETFLDKAKQNADAARVPYVVASEGLAGAGDPHAWLDPVEAATMAQRIEAKLETVDPANAASYQANLASLLAELRSLDAAYREGLAHCAKPRIVTTHEAFGHVARRYHFSQFAVSGLSPEAEPSAARVKEAVETAKRENVTTIFFETLVSDAVAKAIAAELPEGRTEVLDPIEGVSAADAARGETYATLMLKNLDHLRAAMECA